MDYLTTDEYVTYGLTAIDDSKFKGLLTRASLALDVATRRYYQRHDLAIDVALRRDGFKLALALQMEYMQRTGIMTLEDARAARGVNSQSIGNTSVSLGNSSGVDAVSGIAMCDDSMAALSGTGLLWRGIDAC